MRFKIMKCPDCCGSGRIPSVVVGRSHEFCPTCDGGGEVAVSPYRRQDFSGSHITMTRPDRDVLDALQSGIAGG